MAVSYTHLIIEHKLPTVLSTDEIDRLLDATDDLKYKAMFATMYSSGMRVSDVIHLHYDDISRTNMQIHVRDTTNQMCIRDRDNCSSLKSLNNLFSKTVLFVICVLWHFRGLKPDVYKRQA